MISFSSNKGIFTLPLLLLILLGIFNSAIPVAASEEDEEARRAAEIEAAKAAAWKTWHKFFYNKMVTSYQETYRKHLAEYNNILTKYNTIRAKYLSRRAGEEPLVTYQEVSIAYQEALNKHRITINAKRAYEKAIDKFNNEVNSLIRAAIKTNSQTFPTSIIAQTKEVIPNQDNLFIDGELRYNPVFINVSQNYPIPGSFKQGVDPTETVSFITFRGSIYRPVFTNVSQNHLIAGSVTQASDPTESISINPFTRTSEEIHKANLGASAVTRIGFTVRNSYWEPEGPPKQCGNAVCYRGSRGWSVDIGDYIYHKTNGYNISVNKSFFDRSNTTYEKFKFNSGGDTHDIAGLFYTHPKTDNKPSTPIENKFNIWRSGTGLGPYLTNAADRQGFSHGFLRLDGYMTKESKNTNYLAMGYWYTAPTIPYHAVCRGNPKCSNRYWAGVTTRGVFVNGNDPFTQNNIQGLIGTASYSNPIRLDIHNPDVRINAPGLNMNRSISMQEAANFNRRERINKFDSLFSNRLYGDIDLTVDFNSSENLGVIHGNIKNLRGEFYTNNWNNDDIIDLGETMISSYSGQLDLEESNIGSSHSGFFKGSVSGNLNGRQYNGKWGGQFYGNNRSDGYPESVAGTMSAASSDGNFVVAAPWITDKE